MKLNGYRASHRNKWFLIVKKILTYREFLLLEYYIDNMYFDKENIDKFGMFEAFVQEVSLVFGKDPKSVKGWHDGLINKGFIKLTDPLRQLYTVKNPLRYVVGLDKWRGEASKYSHEEANKPEDFLLANIQFIPSDGKNLPVISNPSVLKAINSPQNSLSSLKDVPISNCNKRLVVKQPVRSKAEYQAIYKEGCFVGLTPDDMEWIDINQTFTN